MSRILLFSILVAIVVTVKAQCPDPDPIFIDPGPINFTLPGPDYDIVHFDIGSTHDGIYSVGHSGLIIDLAYNALTQVVSFDISLPSLEIEGNGYGATGEINASPFQQHTIPSGPFSGNGEIRASITDFHMKGTVYILVNLITNRVTVRYVRLENFTFGEAMGYFGYFESSGSVVDWEEWNKNFKSNFYEDLIGGMEEFQEVLNATLNSWVYNKTLSELYPIFYPPTQFPCTSHPLPHTTTIMTTTTTRTTITTTTTLAPDRNCTEEGIYFVPYPGNCSMYMVCMDFELQDEPQTCLPGTLFDPELGQCNLADQVHCRPECPPSGTILLPHSTNCSLFWNCSNGKADLRPCASDLYFDKFDQECHPAHTVMCPLLCPPTGVINLPHDTNCSLYWTCVIGRAELQACLPNLLFDRTVAQCNLAEVVDCDALKSQPREMWKESPGQNQAGIPTDRKGSIMSGILNLFSS